MSTTKTNSLGAFLRRSASTPIILALLVAAVTLLANSAGDASLRRIVVGAVVNMIAVIGIYLFIGMTGVFSFGQLAFMAIGAYATAIFTVPVATKRALFAAMPEWLADINLPFIPGIIAGALVAAAVAFLLSFPMARMQPLSAGLATLAILVAVYTVAGNWTAVTNGSKGMSAIPTNTTVTVALAAVIIVIFAVWVFQQSGLGLRIRATREDAVAARAIGIRVGRERGIAFVASALVMGLAGGLYAQLQGTLSPDAFFLNQTFLLVAMLVVGGLNSLTGAVIGTIVITVYRRVLQQIEAGFDIGTLQIPGRPGLTEVGIGIALLVILALRPSGLTRGAEVSWDALVRFWARATRRPLRRSASAPAPESTAVAAPEAAAEQNGSTVS
jgi:branched-chain amino acid transport system permease protein